MSFHVFIRRGCVANYMGPTIEGLENLLRLPTGCGEQNMLNFAPAVYIARYLDTVGQLDEVTRKKALLFMQTGNKNTEIWIENQSQRC